MTDVFAKCQSTWPVVQELRGAGTYPFYWAIGDRNGGAEGVIDGRHVVIAASNDYLGLATDPRVTEAAAAATARFGASCSGSRLLNGTLELHERLEHELAAFLGRDAAVVTTTGFQANLALACLLGRGDVLLSDQRNHASLIDAARLGYAQHRRFRHNDLLHLERLLSASDPDVGRLVITEGLFSMEGDLADLPGVAELASRYGARLVVDGAHDIGLLGENGRGAAEHFGVEESVDLVTGTFSKCFGSVGGFLAGSHEVITYIRHHGRAVVFSAAAPPGALAAALATLDIVRTEPERRQRVWDLGVRLHEGLRKLGYDTGPSRTPVVPVHVGDDTACMRLWRGLFDAGIFTNAVLPPAVPQGQSLIRLTLTAAHTDEHLARVLEAFATLADRTLSAPAGLCATAP